MKKLVSIVLALALVLLCVGAAFAGTITVDNVKAGETYKAYKLLEYESSGDAYTYFLETSNSKTSVLKSLLENAGFSFTASSDGSRYNLNATAMSADEIVAAFKTAGFTSTNVLEYAEVTPTSDGQAVFDSINPGYWFVTTTVGSLCSIQTYDDEALVVEKNSIPGEDKTQSAAENGTYAKTTLDFNVGDTVYYNLDITDGAGTNQAIVITDTMTDGLDLNQSAIAVTKGGVALATTDYTLTTSAHGFVLTLLADYVAGLENGDVVNVKYSAVINEDAAVHDPDDNSNTARIDYSNQYDEQTIYVETYDFIVYKTDGTDFLDGAEFKLYDAATGGNQILIADEGNGEYVKDSSASADVTIAINSDAGCHVRGLAPGTYYLEEVVVPTGYNKLASREAVTIASGATAVVEVTVVNTAGTILPSTGGIGTTIFYVLGGLLVIGAAVILIARRKAKE